MFQLGLNNHIFEPSITDWTMTASLGIFVPLSSRLMGEVDRVIGLTDNWTIEATNTIVGNMFVSGQQMDGWINDKLVPCSENESEGLSLFCC